MMQSKRIRRVVFCGVVLGAAALVAGCATKGWVNETVECKDCAVGDQSRTGQWASQ